MARFRALDAPAASALTPQRLSWHSNQIGLLANLALARGNYLR